MAGKFSDTVVESHVLQRLSFASLAGVHDTIWKSQRLIEDCHELMAEVDEILKWPKIV